MSLIDTHHMLVEKSPLHCCGSAAVSESADKGQRLLKILKGEDPDSP